MTSGTQNWIGWQLSQREETCVAFIAASGWGSAHRTRVAGDASNRKYDRLTLPDGTTAILMDAPPDKGEDTRPFIKIATYLRDNGLSAPKIIHQDTEAGFLLIEDLGDDLFARVLQNDASLETPLYEAAVDVLLHLHRCAPPELDAYDANTMADLACLTFDWYSWAVTGDANTQSRGRCAAFLTLAFEPLAKAPAVLIQRDYHAENLLWLPDRTGVQRVGLLDFQDAMLGHPAYDLVSVLQDARRDVPPQIETQMIDRYISHAGVSRTEFRDAYALLGLQRNMRILGVFARLCVRDGKEHYVDLIPRVWGHIQTNLHHPGLADMKRIIDTEVPEPSPEALQRIKDQCGKHLNR